MGSGLYDAKSESVALSIFHNIQIVLGHNLC